MASRSESGERVFCHECGNTWPRAEHGLDCPDCHSEFVEILEDSAGSTPSIPPLDDNDQDHDHDHDSRPAGAPNFPPFLSFINSGPQSSRPQHEYEESRGGVTRHHYRSDDGRFTYTSTTIRSPRAGTLPGADNPNQFTNDPLLPLLQNFNSILRGITHDFHDPSNPNQNQNQNPFPQNRFDHDFDAEFLRPRDATRPQQAGNPIDNINHFLSLFNTPMPQHGPGPEGQRGPRVYHAANPIDLLTQMLSMGRHGDAVYSQEELDRVISELIDQNMNGTAPGPASENAIQSLPKKKMDATLMGSDGKAECSICMDSVEIGYEVTVLPCTHWFHEACIGAWLREHDTCPHCRRGIMQDQQSRDNQQQQQQQQQQQGSTSNPSAGGGRGSRADPIIIDRSYEPQHNNGNSPFGHANSPAASSQQRPQPGPSNNHRPTYDQDYQRRNDQGGGGLADWWRRFAGGNGGGA
ncbi:hypothetical protein AJ80_08199 [Polytolypa hystricis UAMH7299]|uniref:RING-type E3 ubiquitin transferase n=1 Tax=Polytolypa hystricis (strain UAMH7299) TaxID=1447883 RepID=A0A2B7XBH1_POLH7|nr:hypothetical protein AJ80_08199 [Polytolypa hystricis UAMH7299]